MVVFFFFYHSLTCHQIIIKWKHDSVWAGELFFNSTPVLWIYAAVSNTSHSFQHIAIAYYSFFYSLMEISSFWKDKLIFYWCDLIPRIHNTGTNLVIISDGHWNWPQVFRLQCSHFSKWVYWFNWNPLEVWMEIFYIFSG